MNTTKQLHKTSLIEFGVRVPNLLDHLDARIDAAILSRAAALAASLFESVTDHSAEDQAALAAKLSTSDPRNVAVQSVQSAAIALGAAALIAVAESGPATASERVRKALVLLSDRYRSDW